MIDIQYKNLNVTNESYKQALNAAQVASAQVKNSIRQNLDPYKIFCIQDARSQIAACEKYVEYITSNFSDLIVIGMGGAVLNPESLINLNQNKNASNTTVHFLSNTDPVYLQNLLNNISLESCAVLAISNSGQTLETNSLVGVMVSVFEKANIKELGNRFFFITKKESGTMSQVARKLSATVIEHTVGISGRFSGLTNVSTFVAAVAGVNVTEYIDGAEHTLGQFLNTDTFESGEKGETNLETTSAAAIYSTKKPIMVNIGYLQQFASFLEWYSQIIAESLGKSGAGITPVRGLGPNDQHSMLQLYLDGPCDKFYSLFYVKELSHDLVTNSLEELGYIANKKLSDINTANFAATQIALETRKQPLRIIKLKDLSAKTIGAFVTHIMLEVIILGVMMRINPFDQPGVELIKASSRKIVSNNLLYSNSS